MNRFIRFIMVGVINTINYYIVYLIMNLLGITYIISHITGFIVSFVISFLLNCRFVYRVRPTFRRFAAYPLTQVVNMGGQTLMLYVGVEYLHIDRAVAPIPVMLLMIPVTYIITTYLLKEENNENK